MPGVHTLFPQPQAVSSVLELQKGKGEMSVNGCFKMPHPLKKHASARRKRVSHPSMVGYTQQTVAH